MKNTVIQAATATAIGLLLMVPQAHAITSTYNITTTWFEPETQPRDSIFKGSFTYDSETHTVSNLQGLLSESMSGTNASDMTWLQLNYQLQTWHDATLGGTFAATFLNNNTSTFTTTFGGDGWSPQSGVDVGGVYAGWPKAANNPGNAYALIFVPDAPLTSLTQAQLDKVAYADCAPLVGPNGLNGGGMMGAVCMTGTSEAGYGHIGTMSGVPFSQTITAANVATVPEPGTTALLLTGLGVAGVMARRRRTSN